jgi:hypothetical protein
MKKAAKKSKIACAVELLKRAKRAGAKKVTFFSTLSNPYISVAFNNTKDMELFKKEICIHVYLIRCIFIY